MAFKTFVLVGAFLLAYLGTPFLEPESANHKVGRNTAWAASGGNGASHVAMQANLDPLGVGEFFQNLFDKFTPDAHKRAPRTPEQQLQYSLRDKRLPLDARLFRQGFKMGDPVYIRIFKEENLLEVWMRSNNNGPYELFDTFPICQASGVLGPKLKEGDLQAPEGFYEVNLRHLNPNSRYHLAVNMGYPNAYDRAHGRTGSALMIHGACASIGCYALTNEHIEDVYQLIEAAFKAGQESIAVHAFPFKMTGDALIAKQRNKWINFWVEELLPVYQAFETSGYPPTVMTCGAHYQIMDGLDPTTLPRGCEPIVGWSR